MQPWRQRFPEQITAGPTGEEGIAIAPDGRSFITAVGLSQSSVWVHDGNGERHVSTEGYSYDPMFAPDGKKLYYRIAKGNDPLSDSSVSPDGRQMVAGIRDQDGNLRACWRL